MTRTAFLVFCCVAALHPAAAAGLRIGVAAPLTGPDAVFGAQVRRGVEQAIADANAAGGFNGAPARVEARDDANEPGKAGDVARAFVQAGVPVVIGHLSSAASIPASTIYGEAGTLEIAPLALAPLLTERGVPTLFRMCGRDDAQAGIAARYLLSRRLMRVAIVHDRTGPGKALADGLREALAKAGLRDAFYGSMDRARGADAGLVDRIKASAAQLVFFGGGAAEAALLVFPEDPKARPAAAEVLRRLRSVGFEPDASFFYAYAAVQVVQQAAEAAHSLDPAALAAALHGARAWKTVLGDVTFDAKGDPTVPDDAVQLWRRGTGGRMTLDGQART